ncbi:aminoacyl-tRNA deacylase [Puteibacter caeruleilacunae]|nr:aminoacyl-tRNA deacylase [Puteibacter caeruleilacunae]
MAKLKKTNAMRILDRNKVAYKAYDRRELDKEELQKELVVEHGIQIYKTLVTISSKKNICVCVIPLDETLDLKKVAKATGEKKVDMLPQKELLETTGYIKKGCSPIGMKKLYPTLIAEQAMEASAIIVSGGAIGLSVEVPVKDLMKVVNAQAADVVVEE